MPADLELRSLADTVEIAPGVHMPRLGLGTYKSDEGPDVEGADRVRPVDRLPPRSTPPRVYGNEAGVGRAVRAGDRPRDGRLHHHEALELRPGLRVGAQGVRREPRQARAGLRRPLPRPLAVARAHARHVARDGAAARERAHAGHRRVQLPPAPPRRTRRVRHDDAGGQPVRVPPAPSAARPPGGVRRARHHPAGVGADHARPREPHPRARRDREPSRQDAGAGLDSLDPPEGHRHHPQVRSTRPASPRTAMSTTSSSPPRRWRRSTRSTLVSVSGRTRRPTPGLHDGASGHRALAPALARSGHKVALWLLHGFDDAESLAHDSSEAHTGRKPNTTRVRHPDGRHTDEVTFARRNGDSVRASARLWSSPVALRRRRLPRSTTPTSSRRRASRRHSGSKPRSP